MVLLNKQTSKISIRIAIVAVILLSLLLPQYRTPRTSAETIKELQAKSSQLQADIDANKAKALELSKTADSLQSKIAQLNIEINQATKEIELTNIKLEDLSKRLIAAEAELERQKSLLKASLRALYSRTGASTVELLMASDSFSDFINQQEYLDRLQSAVKTSTDQVVALKQQIEAEKVTQEALLQTQKEQRTLVDARRAEEQAILDQTQGEESRYQATVAQQQKELQEAEDQLAALLSAGTYVSYGPVLRGQKIGQVGSTGFSTGPHVHFQVYHNGNTVNPYAGNGVLINGYTWPLPNSPGAGYVSQLYGCVAPAWYYSVSCNNGQNSFHSGLDIYGPAYSPMVAADDGEVIFKGCRAGLGYVIVIDHGGGWQTWYPHQVTPTGQVYGYC